MTCCIRPVERSLCLRPAGRHQHPHPTGTSFQTRQLCCAADMVRSKISHGRQGGILAAAVLGSPTGRGEGFDTARGMGQCI